MAALRFAPIIRVSTEKQEKKGNSLNTQKEQIIQFVELSHKGTIPESCWQYSGQEHATPDQERKKLEKLLSDSSKGIFDAVIVCDASRWSRDNLKSKEGLKILRDNGIKFFVGSMEYDLYNPEHIFYLGISAEIGEFQARQGSYKSILNRINKAKRGVPASGMLPYGRTFDKKKGDKTGWGIDEDKKRIIEKCAERYLKGESYKDIARTYGMDFTNLWTILNKGCGDTMTCRFRFGNIDETVTIKIPRLLDEETIKAIKKQSVAKNTYLHGNIKHPYLLGRMVFCANCGYTMTGFTSTSGRRYYRHARDRNVRCDTPKYVYATELENAVLIHLITTLGDPERMNEAIKQATPDLNKVEALEKEKTELDKELLKVTKEKNVIIVKISKELITDKEAKGQLEKLRAREESINNRIKSITDELNTIPDMEKVKRLSKFGMAVYQNAIKKSSPTFIFTKSYKWKRNLMEYAFAGTDIRGKRLGVYVDKTESGWSFEIRGILENTILSLPLSDEYLIDKFNIDSEYQDEKEALQEIRKSLSSLGKGLPYLFHRISPPEDFL